MINFSIYPVFLLNEFKNDFMQLTMGKTTLKLVVGGVAVGFIGPLQCVVVLVYFETFYAFKFYALLQ